LTPITLIASLLFIRTEQGRIGWFVLERGQVIIDGEHTSGYFWSGVSACYCSAAPTSCVL